MDSPMPVLVALMVGTALVYQLFFRYDHWAGGSMMEIAYERDNLTGEVHVLKPGEKYDFVSRLLGQQVLKVHENEGQAQKSVSKSEPIDALHAAVVEQKKTVSAPLPPGGAPVPGGGSTAQEDFEDLNRDGEMEKLSILNASGPGQEEANGQEMMDLQLTSKSKRIFFGQGLGLSTLSTRHAGWADLQLEIDEHRKLVYQFNPKLESYVLTNSH